MFLPHKSALSHKTFRYGSESRKVIFTLGLEGFYNFREPSPDLRPKLAPKSVCLSLNGHFGAINPKIYTCDRKIIFLLDSLM